MTPKTGMTLKQFAAQRFYAALEAYRIALESGTTEEVLATSIAVYLARRNEADRAAINRVFRTTTRKVQP